MSFFDLFIGSEQSKYAGLAIASVIFVICLSVLLTSTDVSLMERITTVLFMILIVIFPVGLALFELTCIVNGNSNGLCGYYAWIVTALIVFHCLVIIVFTFSSMFTYKKAIVAVDADMKVNNVSQANAQYIAESMMNMGEDSDITMPVMGQPEKKKDVKQQGGDAPVGALMGSPLDTSVSAPPMGSLMGMVSNTEASPKVGVEIQGYSDTEYSEL